MPEKKYTGDWRACYEEWKSRFYLFARQQARTATDAEDILQEALVKVWGQSKGAEATPGMVFGQIRRAAIDWGRKESRRTKREAVFGQEASEGSWFREGGPGSGLDVEGALRSLAAEQQEVLVLKIWCGLSFAEIGDALDVSANTAASRYRYGLQGMRRYFGEEVTA